MKHFPWILLILFSRVSPQQTDLCHQLAARSGNQSRCDDSGICVGLFDSVNHRPITCKDAFNRFIDASTRMITVPPIFSTVTRFEDFECSRSTSMYAEIMFHDEDPEYFSLCQPPPRDDVDASLLEPVFVSTGPLVFNITDRIISSFPLLVFNSSSDGLVLRQLVSAARAIQRAAIDQPAILLAVHQSDWMRQYAWCIRTMVDHWANSPNLSFKDTERYLSSIAPWMHAFLHALFIMKIQFQNVFDDCASWDIVNAIVRYHPKYTKDDGVWYIRSSRQWTQITRPPLIFDSPDEDYISSLWEGVPEHPLNASMTALMSSAPGFSIFYDQHLISVAFLTLKFLGPYSLHIPLEEANIESINDYVGTDFSAALSSRIAFATVFGYIVTPSNLMSLVTPISTSNTYVPIRLNFHKTVMLIPRDTLALSTIYQVSKLTKYHLAGKVEFELIDGGESTSLTDGLEGFFEDVLEDIFHTQSGFFERGNNSVYRRSIESSGEYPLEDFLSYSQISTSIGRIFGLVFKFDDSRPLLARYIRPEKNNSTVYETLFFSSFYIRNGFYDVYHDNMIETLFSNNGSKFLQGLVS